MLSKKAKLTIKSNPNGDTRTTKDISYEAFKSANMSHIDDVRKVMKWIADRLIFRKRTVDICYHTVNDKKGNHELISAQKLYDFCKSITLNFVESN